MPIAMVTPYVSNFKIHGMVSRKEEIRTFPAKNTKVFNFEITDSNGDTIRCTAFNEVAESLYTTITENLVSIILIGLCIIINLIFSVLLFVWWISQTSK